MKLIQKGTREAKVNAEEETRKAVQTGVMLIACQELPNGRKENKRKKGCRLVEIMTDKSNDKPL